MSPLHAQIPPVAVEPQPLGRVLASAEAAGLLRVPTSLAATPVTDVVADSRRAGPGALFAALTSDGDGADGHAFVDAALKAGASAALVSKAWAAFNERDGLVPTADPRAAVAEAAASLHGHPGDELTLVGITGTNGKTTTAFLVHHLITTLGGTAGLVGTVENRIGTARYATNYTTPEAPDLQRLLRAMVQGGVQTAVMEVSSHGLALDRVRTLGFQVAAFTNLTHDHLDFHKTPEAYAAAKKSLFDGLAPDAVAVVNANDPAWMAMTRDTKARVVTTGTIAGVQIRFRPVSNGVDGLVLRLDNRKLRFRVAGKFNTYNIAVAYAIGRELGYAQEETLDALMTADGVPGRFEVVGRGAGILGLVDYAHTPDALDNVLATAREVVPAGNRLAVVIGCGGDRDRAKRPEMARIAEARADRVLLTSDNPRTEDPAAILADMRAGLARPEAASIIPDRAKAIASAVIGARRGDVVVVAGKGHETYQIVGATKHPFDDREVLGAALAARFAPGVPEHDSL